MELSAFVLRTALLFFPGILGALVYRKLRGRPEKKIWEDFVQVLVFSLISYGASRILIFMPFAEAAGDKRSIASTRPATASKPSTDTASEDGTKGPSALEALCDQTKPLNWSELSIASGFGVIFGFVGGYIHRYSIVNRIGLKIRASNRFGDEDIWETFLNGRAKWVIVRDLRRNMMFFGFVRYYSDSGKQREILLEEVDVYTNDTGDLLYSSAAVYLCRAPDELSIEVPVELRDQYKGPKQSKLGKEMLHDGQKDASGQNEH